MKTITMHAVQQLRERYGLVVSCKEFRDAINASDQKIVHFGKGGTLVQEVELEQAGERKLVRYLTDSTKQFVITVLPNEFGSEHARHMIKKTTSAHAAARTRQHKAHNRIVDEDEEEFGMHVTA